MEVRPDSHQLGAEHHLVDIHSRDDFVADRLSTDQAHQDTVPVDGGKVGHAGVEPRCMGASHHAAVVSNVDADLLRRTVEAYAGQDR